jgi:hypothetical protein
MLRRTDCLQAGEADVLVATLLAATPAAAARAASGAGSAPVASGASAGGASAPSHCPADQVFVRQFGRYEGKDELPHFVRIRHHFDFGAFQHLDFRVFRHFEAIFRENGARIRPQALHDGVIAPSACYDLTPQHVVGNLLDHSTPPPKRVLAGTPELLAKYTQVIV